MIDIIKLPDKLNLDNLIENKMKEVYGVCPYCLNREIVREGKRDWCYTTNYGYDKHYVAYEKSYYDTKSLTKTGLFRKRYNWFKLYFHCFNCGMEWSSPEYPILGGDKEANKAIFNAWMNGQNMEINTLLIGVLDKDK